MHSTASEGVSDVCHLPIGTTQKLEFTVYSSVTHEISSLLQIFIFLKDLDDDVLISREFLLPVDGFKRGKAIAELHRTSCNA